MKSWQFMCLAVVLPAVWLVCQGITLGSPAFAQASPDTSDHATKLVEEINKLKAEFNEVKKELAQFKALQQPNIVNVTGVGGLAAFIGFVASWLAMRSSRKMSKDQLEQELFLAREEHRMSLISQLGGESLPVRIASATLLFDRIQNAGDSIGRKHGTNHEQGRVLQALVSATKEDNPDPNLAKVIGDELVRVVGAVVPEGRPPSKAGSPLRSFGGGPLDLQKVKFPEVYWRRVDARGVDFYRADFTKAGLREAFLQKAIFFGACMKDCVLRDADLSEANLQNADLSDADLRGANLTGAVLVGTTLKGAKVDAKTIWPEGFDPKPAL